jgi:ADP-heptose:LPS heptosyltransferase
VITNDSGLLHMAEAVGRPVLAFMGPTSPAFGYAPYRPDSRLLYHPPRCSPCSKNGSRPCHRPTHECMINITVPEAVEAAEAVERMRPNPAARTAP